jgi:hypothetical protein
MNDCGFSDFQSKGIVISLLLLDSSGKLFAASGIYRIYQWLHIKMTFLGQLSPKAQVFSAGAGLLLGLTNWHFDQAGARFYKNKNHYLVSTSQDIDHLVDQAERGNINEFANTILQTYKNEFESLTQYLGTDELTQEERIQIETRVNELELLIRGIELALPELAS